MEIWLGFMFGFLGSPHCIGMCGPIAHANSIVPMKDNVINFQLHSTAIRKFKTVWITK